MAENIHLANQEYNEQTPQLHNGSASFGANPSSSASVNDSDLESGQQHLLGSGNSKDGTSTIDTFRFDANKSRIDLAHMIIVHKYPFSIVSHSRFRKFINGVQPLFKLPSRDTVISDCMQIYEHEMTKLRDNLEMTNGRISLTYDMWTSSCQRHCYLCLTAHYIDNSWKMQKKTLNFVAVDTRHTGEELAIVIRDCLLKWNIDRKLFSITLDNCSITNDVIVRKLMEWLLEKDALPCNGKVFQVRCVAHILKLFVQDGVKEISEVIEKIRKTIKYINASPGRCGIFDRAVCHVKVDCEKKLCLDVPTRWNSTFLMLDVALKYKDAFDRFQELDPHYHFAPSKDEWKKATAVKNCLEIFYDVINAILGVKYQTSNIFFKKFCEIKVEIDRLCSSSDICLSNMAKMMKENFDKYWNTCNLILAIAVIFDPRYKMKIIEFYYRKFYAEEAHEYIATIKSYLYELYDEFKAIYASNTFSTSYIINGSEDNDASGFTSSVDISSHKKLRTSALDDFIEESSRNQCTKTDLELYLEEPIYPRNIPIDILMWWKVNACRYPILSKMGFDILAIPISTIHSESTFNTRGRILDSYRSRLGAKTVEALICTQNWLRDQTEDDSDLPLLLSEEERSFASAYITAD